MPTLTWLHLSDVHLPPGTTDTYQVDKVLKALIDTLKEEAARGQKPDVIFFTGDIADKGKDYGKAEKFFDDLLDATGLAGQLDKKARQRLFVVPGNHDVDRDKTKLLKRPLDTVEQADEFFAPQSTEVRQRYFGRFHAYEEFFNRYFGDIRKCSVDQHYYVELLDLDHIRIRLGIVGLNSAWFCQGEDDEHQLWVGERVCDAAFNSPALAGGADLIIVLHHHPYSWLHPKEVRFVKGLLTEKADVCLYGHLREPETEEIKDQHGKILRFQSGATYDGSPYPYRVLWGIVDLQASKVLIRPMTYQAGPPRRWTLDTSLFPHKAPDYTEDFDLPRPINQMTSGLSQCDPVTFFSGGMPTEADIAAGLDVLRTQFIRAWIDENGLPQKAWKDLLFTQASKTLSQKKICVVIVYGHRGSGKTTLCKRMIYDLKASSIPVVDLLAEPLAPVHVDGILTQIGAAPGKCIHVFTEIENIQEAIVFQQLATAIKRLAHSKTALTIYISIDTNKWKQIEARIGSTVQAMGCLLQSRHLRGQLDEQELADLIYQLKGHHCLFRLEHKTDEAIWSLFRRKAKRGLLTSLIEATRGTEEGQELAEILWQEFQGLSDRAKWAYGLVMLFGAFGIAVPSSVMEGALTELTGDQGYFESAAFNTETAEIVYRSARTSYKCRHRLVAETVLQKFREAEWDGFKYRLLYATLHSLDFSIPLHRTFFEMVLDRKVLRVVTNLDPLIQNVMEGRIGSVQGYDISRVLNSIIRIYQGQGKYQEGKQLAGESLEHWNHIGNQASYLRAFCCYHLGENEEVRKAALELVNVIDYPFHVLHGIALLRVLRDWQQADKALKIFKQSMGSDAALYSDYHHLRREVDLGLSVTWSDSEIDSLKPAMALERIEHILIDSGADEKTIITQYGRLISRQHNFFRGYLSFFSYLRRPRAEDDEDVLLERYKVLQHNCEYHLGQHYGHYRSYPNDVRSFLHSNLARALFKIDYVSENGYQHREACADHFLKAIGVKRDNWYAHNWYGTFLKEVRKDGIGARMHYEHAVNGDKRNPMFKHNLALLYYEVPTFSREGLEKARTLTLDTLTLCTADPQWEYFRQYPEELLANLSLLLARTDLKDGAPLDADKSLPPDGG